jgi:hypothetical protein
MSEHAIKLFGTDEPVPDSIELAAGPVTVDFENGALRGIRLSGVEVLRGIFFTVRDHNWSTAVPALSNLKIERTPGGFRLGFDAVSRTDAGELPWRGEITGGGDGSIVYSFVARPKRDFATNRTGFIVLHPLEHVAGCPVEVEHVDGTRESSRFPDLIDPSQCFFDIRALSHEPIPGIRATCRMEGGSWECEDHRNWTDASYKTYVRPLSLPWPYVIPGGTEVRQSVSLSFSPSVAQIAPSPRPDRITVALGAPTGATMPEIGVGVLPERTEQALAVADTLKSAGLQLLNCRIDPRAGQGRPELERYRELAHRLAAQVILEVIVPCVEDPAVELARVAKDCASVGLFPRAIAVTAATDLASYPPGVNRPDTPPLKLVYGAARAAFPGVTIGGGMLSYFTELNRVRPSLAELDYVMHSTCATVHAADDRSVMETIEALPHIIRSTRAFIADKPYFIGPSNIGMSFNPYGSATTPNPGNGRVTMAHVDPRQRGLFAAAWATGYLAEMVRGGVRGVSLFAPAGEFGIVHHPMPYPQPGFEMAPAGTVYPAFHVLAGFARVAGAPTVATTPSDRKRVQAVACLSGDAIRIWLANLTPERQRVAIQGVEQGSVILLDETGFERAIADPAHTNVRASPLAGALEIGAYGVAQVVATARGTP